MSQYIRQKGSQEPQKSKKELKRIEELRKQGLDPEGNPLPELQEEVEPEVEEIVDLSKAEQAVEKNYKSILLGLLGLILIAAAFIFFQNRGSGKDKKAAQASVAAQAAFNKQDWKTAIEGKDGQLGFAEIATKYKGSRLGNLANYYTGVSYMKQGEYQKAIDYLKNFHSTKDPNVNGLAYMNLADAQMELDQADAALSSYKKATEAKSEGFGDLILSRYALAQFKAGKRAEAKASFERLVRDYPKSQQVGIANQYIEGL